MNGKEVGKGSELFLIKGWIIFVLYKIENLLNVKSLIMEMGSVSKKV